LLLVGVICAKARIIDDHTRASLSDLILDVFLPCNILASFFSADSSQLASLVTILVISTCILAVTFILARYVLFPKANAEQKKVLIYGTIISNASFIGNPVVESIFGLEALVYSSVYLLPLRVAIWTVGVAVFSGVKGGLKKLIFHPCLVATYLGIAIMLMNFSPPLLVSRLTTALGNCTTPVSMMVAGSILATVKPKAMFSRLTAYHTFIRLVLIPFAVFGALWTLSRVFRIEPIVLGVSVILSGCPTPVTTSILADKYGSDRELASKLVFASTLFSILTIPLFIILLHYL
jgi:predicted permease